MFMDWMAAPAVPLTRLSTAVTTTTRFAARSIARPISAVLAPSTSAVRGNSPCGQQLHERLVAVRGLPRAADVGVRRTRRDRRRRGREDAARHRHEDGREGDADAFVRALRVSSRGRASETATAPRRAPGGSRGCAGACRRRRTGSRVPRISLARRFVLRLLPAPDGPDGEHRDDVGRVDDPGRDAGREAQAHGRRVAAGRGDAGRADEPLALLRSRRRGARARRRSTGRGSRRRRTGPSPRPTRAGGRRRRR